MANSKNQNAADKNVPFGVTDYFQRGVLPLSIYGGLRTVSSATPSVQSEDNLLGLVTSGKGVMFVNHEKIELRRGVIFCLGPFHNYSIVPAPGEKLVYSEAHMNNGAYMYVLSCPYLKINTFITPSESAVASLSETDTVQAEKSFRAIREDVDREYYKNKMDFLYVIELLGLLMARLSDSGDTEYTSGRPKQHGGGKASEK